MLRALPLLLPLPLFLPGTAAVGEVQVVCDGTLLTARGTAERERPVRFLRFSLRLSAEAAEAEAALSSLQRRLADVRTALEELEVEQLRVTSPSTWERPAERGRRRQVSASLQVSGRVAPGRLQPLIRRVGALPGVALAPVTPEAEPAEDLSLRRELLRQAYRDAYGQAMEVATAIGRSRIAPLEVSLEGGVRPPLPLRAEAVNDAPPPFDPEELPPPTDRFAVLVRFCAR
jgi:uncharacterized protein YggE